jgi:GntR family transcriptional regulator/MocR family aminotransferase
VLDGGLRAGERLPPSRELARQLSVSRGTVTLAYRQLAGEGYVETRVVHASPSHQFPMGVTMPLPRRLALLAWASRHGAAIVEDDYDSEFRYSGRPIEPLQTLDTAGRVIYVGSFVQDDAAGPPARLGGRAGAAALRAAK